MREPQHRAARTVPPKPDDNFHNIDDAEFWRDVLFSASAISMFLHGTPDMVRSVYHVVETSNSLPTFRFGGRLSARKSIIRANFWAQERRAFLERKDEHFVRLGVLLQKLNDLMRAAKDTQTSPHEMQLWGLLLDETAHAVDRVLKSG